MLFSTSQPNVLYRLAPKILQSWQRGSVYLLLLLMPTAVFWFFGRPSSIGIFPLLAQPTWYLSDLAIIAVFILHWRRISLSDNKTREIDTIWLALCVIALLTAVTAIVPHYAFYTALRWGLAFLIYRILLQAPISLPHMVGVFIGGLGIQSVLGIIQSITRKPIGLPGEMIQPAYHVSRAIGMTFHPNVFAGYLVVGLLLAVPLLKYKRFLPIWWLMWAGWFATASRSSAVALSLTLPIALIWFFWHRPAYRYILLIALVGAFGSIHLFRQEGGSLLFRTYSNKVAAQLNGTAEQTRVAETSSQPEIILTPIPEQTAPSEVIAPPKIVPTSIPKTESKAPEIVAEPSPSWLSIQTTRVQKRLLDEYAINYRWRLNKIAFGVLVARPLQGLGAGNFPLTMLGKTTENGPDNPHNVPMLLAAEVGILGGGVWFLLAGLGVWWLFRHWNSQHGWLIVGLCAWLALVGEGMFEYYPWGLETGRLLTMFVWVVIGRSLPTPSTGE